MTANKAVEATGYRRLTAADREERIHRDDHASALAEDGPGGRTHRVWARKYGAVNHVPFGLTLFGRSYTNERIPGRKAKGGVDPPGANRPVRKPFKGTVPAFLFLLRRALDGRTEELQKLCQRHWRPS